MVKCERGWKVTFWEKKLQPFLATSFWERPNRPCSEREIFLSLQSRAHPTHKRPPGNISRARARALLLSSSGVDDPFRLFLLLFLFWNTTFNLNFFFDNYLDHIQLIVLVNSLRLWLSFFWRSFCNARRSSSDKGSSCLINMIFIFVGAFSNIMSNF